MRTFIALELPESFIEETALLAASMSRRVAGRFMPRESYHLTLAFLGEVDEVDVRRAMDAVDAACAECEPVALSCNGLGTFGRKGDATLWLGLAPNEGVTELAARVRDELVRRDITFDRKNFVPHITIARRARIAKGALDGLAFPFDALGARVTLFKSTLAPTGAQYKPLYSTELGTS